MSLIKEFKKARKEKGWTQREVATKAGLSMNYYSMIEQGKANPTRDKLKSIGRVLNVKVDL